MAETEHKEKREGRAVATFVRMSPRKLRFVMDGIRGKMVTQAKSILKFATKRAARTLAKVLDSAVANAENNYKIPQDSLIISRAFVDVGPTMKRHLPRAMGRASLVHKRTSHITIVVKEKEA